MKNPTVRLKYKESKFLGIDLKNNIPYINDGNDGTNYITIVKLSDYLNEKSEPLKRKYGNQSPLCKAAYEGNVEDCKTLIECGEDINEKAPNSNYNTPLARASASGHYEVCKLLLAQPTIDINKGGYKNRCPLLMCSWEGRQSIVELLLAHPNIGPSLLKAGEDGHTPLKKGKTSKIKQLIQEKIDLMDNGGLSKTGQKVDPVMLKLEKQKKNQVGLKGSHGKYLQASTPEKLKWDSDTLGDFEIFELYARNGQVAFQSVQHNSAIKIRMENDDFIPYLKKGKPQDEDYFWEINLLQDKCNVLLTNLDEVASDCLLHRNNANELPLHVAFQSNISSTLAKTILRKSLSSVQPNNINKKLGNPWFPDDFKLKIGLEVSVTSKRNKEVTIGQKYVISSVDEKNDKYWLKDPIKHTTLNAIFKRKDLIKYLSRGTILHTLLDKPVVDMELFDIIVNEYPKMCSIKDDCNIFPVQIAARMNHKERLIRILWNKLDDKRTLYLAIQCSQFEEAKKMLQQEEKVLVDIKCLFLCMDMYEKCATKDLLDGHISDLVDIVKLIVQNNPNCIRNISRDFETRKKVRFFLTQIYRQKGTVYQILTGTLKDSSAYKYMQDWYTDAKLLLIRGDHNESSCTNGNELHCKAYSTWGARGYLFKHGKIYYECTVVKHGPCPQLGWADATFKPFVGHTEYGVGDCTHSWAADGERLRAWHNGYSGKVILPPEAKWNDNDIVGIAVDIDGPKKTFNFHMSINGKWRQTMNVFKTDCSFKEGLFPAMTIKNGTYNVNYGETKMNFGPPTDEYRTVIDAMKHQSRVEEVIEFNRKRRSLSRASSKLDYSTMRLWSGNKNNTKNRKKSVNTSRSGIFSIITKKASPKSKKRKNRSPTNGSNSSAIASWNKIKKVYSNSGQIDEDDRLLFVPYSSYCKKNNWKPNASKNICLRPTKTNLLIHEEDTGDITMATKKGGNIDIEGHNNLSINDMKISIKGTVLHYLVAEGIYSEKAMKEMFNIMEDMLFEKDGLGRLPLEIAAEKKNKKTANIMWEKMKKTNRTDINLLELLMKANLWDAVKIEFEERELQNNGLKKYFDELCPLPKENSDVPAQDHPIHWASKYGADLDLIKKILDADETLIRRKGSNNRNILHYLAEADANKDIVEYVIKRFQKPGDRELEEEEMPLKQGSNENEIPLDKIEDPDDRTPMTSPNNSDDEEQMIKLLEDSNKMSPLHYATAFRCGQDLVKMYIEFQKSIKKIETFYDSSGLTASHWIVNSDTNFNAKFLLEGKKNNRSLDIIKTFIDYNIPVNTKLRIGEKYEKYDQQYSPLHLAIISNTVTPAVFELLYKEQKETEESKNQQENVQQSETDSGGQDGSGGLDGGGGSGDDNRNVEQQEEKKKKKRIYTLHLAAQYVTSEEVLKKIAKEYKEEIQKSDDNEMTPLHHAASSNENPHIVQCLLDIEEECLKEKKKESLQSKTSFSDMSVAKKDNKGCIPLHLAASSKYATDAMINTLIAFHKKASKKYDKKESHGGADEVNNELKMPLHLAIGADYFRSKTSYSSIINIFIETYSEGVCYAKSDNELPLVLALDANSPKRLKKIKENVLKKMLDCYKQNRKQEIPQQVDLSLYCAINDDVFNTFVDTFKTIFTSGTTRGLGQRLTHLYPQLFKGKEIINHKKNLKWKYWFYLHTSVFEGIELMKLNHKDIDCGLANLIKYIDKYTVLEKDFEDIPIVDTPLSDMFHMIGEISSSSIINSNSSKFWLKPILDEIEANKTNDTEAYPLLIAPLAHAVRNGCIPAIIALSEGDCDPVRTCFPKDLHWNVCAYDLANCASRAKKMNDVDKSKWKVGMEAMRKTRSTKKYRNQKALNRLFTFQKVPLELITITLFILIGIFTSTGGGDTQHLRFANHITELFVDEEFDPEDAHIEKIFFDIANIDEFWQWVDGPFYKGLYPDHDVYINGRKAIDEVTVIIGNIRIRQVRAKPTQCKNSIGVHTTSLPTDGCHSDPVSDVSLVQKESFGPGGKYKYTDPSLESNEEAKLYEQTFVGDRLWQYYYLSGGHNVYLPGGNGTRAAEILAELKNDKFVSTKDGTRLMLFEFSLYNSHIDRVLAVRLMVEFWVGGGTHSNIDVTVLGFTDLATTFGQNLLQTILMLIFVIRALVEVNEMAWGNLRSIAGSVQFGKASTDESSEMNNRLDYDTVRKYGLTLGEFSWKPYTCWNQNATIFPERFTKIQKKLQVSKTKLQKSVAKVITVDRLNPINSKIAELTLLQKHSKKRNTCCKHLMNSIGNFLATFQIFLFVLAQLVGCCGSCLVRRLTKSRKNDLHGSSQLGMEHRYHNQCFSMWWQSVRRNKYFSAGWNIYELVLIAMYFAYWTMQWYKEQFENQVRPKIVSALSTGEETYIPLDRLSWLTTESQDWVAVLFIFISVHLLRIMTEIPFGIGERVMAILKVFGHRDIIPFYITIVVVLFSFAIGFHFAYANEINEYRFFYSSFLNILLASLGDFGIGMDHMMDSTIWISYIFILMVIFIIALVLMNIFIGVVSMVYEKSERESILSFNKQLDRYMLDEIPDEEKRDIEKCLSPEFLESVAESQLSATEYSEKSANKPKTDSIIMALKGLCSIHPFEILLFI